jgi:flagellar protein FliO/FliZ
MPTGAMLWQMASSLILVLVLAAVAAIVLRKVMPRLRTASGRPGRSMRIVETLSLGPKRSIHLVEVGPKRFLVGDTPSGLTMLGEAPAPPREDQP